MTKTAIPLQISPKNPPRKPLNLQHQSPRPFHTSKSYQNTPPPPHQPQPSSGQTPHSHTQSPRPPRRQIGRFSLPVFLFFAFTFAAITTSMDTRPAPSHRSHPQSSARQLPTNDPNELDASPTSPFVDDDGNAIVPAASSDEYGYDEADGAEGGKGIRDVEKERQHDTFNRYGRQRRVPWTLKEVAEAERWQRESRGSALRVEREEEGKRL